MRERTAKAYLVIEERRPHSWQNGDHTITKVLQRKPDKGDLPAGARILPIEVVIPQHFFNPEVQRIVIAAEEQPSLRLAQ